MDWHLVTRNDTGSSPFTHHPMSLIVGILMFVGIWLYVIGKRRGHDAD